jgi:hypothetical protein
MAFFVQNPETGEFELDYSDGLPYEGDPFDPATGQMWRADLLPPGVDAGNPWVDGYWNTGTPKHNLDDPEGPPPTPPPGPPPPPPPPPPAPTPTGGTYGGSSGLNLASLLTPFSGQFSAPNPRDAARLALELLPPVPTLTLPEIPTIDPFSYAPWTQPDPQDVFKDPSFEFRRGIGERAITNSRAAQGLSRSGMALKDLLEYNQGFASQEFGNIWNRSREAYDTNRGNALENWRANTDTTLRRSGMEQDRAKSLYEPLFAEYQNKVGAVTRAPQEAFNNALSEFRTNWDLWRDQRDSVFDKLKWQTEFDRDSAAL